MKKLRTGLEKKIIYVNKEENENTELSIKVKIKLTDINTGREIIFLNFDDEKNNIFQTQFICKIGKKVENISEKNFDRFFNEKEKGKFAYFRDVYINDLVQIEITKENIPKIVIDEDTIKHFSSFYISYDVEYSKMVIQYYVTGRKVEESYKILSKEEFIKELNKLPEDILELQRNSEHNLFFYDTEIE